MCLTNHSFLSDEDLFLLTGTDVHDEQLDWLTHHDIDFAVSATRIMVRWATLTNPKEGTRSCSFALIVVR